MTYDINSVRPVLLGQAGDKNATTIKFTGWQPRSEENTISLIMGWPNPQVIPLTDMTLTVTEDITAKPWSDIPMRLQETAEGLIHLSPVFWGEVR